MKLGLIGDVHAEDEVLTKVIEFLDDRKVDDIFCMGDVVDGAGCANKCCEILSTNNIETIRGNHDRWIFEGRDDLTPLSTLTPDSVDFLKQLPITSKIETDIGGILFCHGVGDNDMARVNPVDTGYALEVHEDLHKLIANKDISIVINGHSHRKMVRKFNGLIMINVGTIFHEHRPCFAELDCTKGIVEFFDIAKEGGITPSETIHLSDIPNEIINIMG